MAVKAVRIGRSSPPVDGSVFRRICSGTRKQKTGGRRLETGYRRLAE